MVGALAAAPIRCYVTLLDIELGLRDAPEFFRTDEDTYATGLMFLAERFQLLLEAADDVGMIVVDSRFREDDARLRRFFADLTKDGSPYSRLDRIVEGLFLGPSHYSIGLQCADLVCAITAAAERGNGQARGYLKTLLPRFATHPATGDARRRRDQALPGDGAPAARRLDAALTCLAEDVRNTWRTHGLCADARSRAPVGLRSRSSAAGAGRRSGASGGIGRCWSA